MAWRTTQHKLWGSEKSVSPKNYVPFNWCAGRLCRYLAYLKTQNSNLGVALSSGNHPAESHRKSKKGEEGRRHRGWNYDHLAGPDKTTANLEGPTWGFPHLDQAFRQARKEESTKTRRKKNSRKYLLIGYKPGWSGIQASLPHPLSCPYPFLYLCLCLSHAPGGGGLWGLCRGILDFWCECPGPIYHRQRGPS